MRDIIDFLEIREHWWEYEKESRAKLKSKTRSQFKSMIKKLDLELTKDGLKDLSKEQ